MQRILQGSVAQRLLNIHACAMKKDRSQKTHRNGRQRAATNVTLAASYLKLFVTLRNPKGRRSAKTNGENNV
jgi:hypothetical protein